MPQPPDISHAHALLPKPYTQSPTAVPPTPSLPETSEKPKIQASSGCRVFVGGIPFGMTEASLARVFDGIALPLENKVVTEVVIMHDSLGAPLGYGFVSFASARQAERARNLLHKLQVEHRGNSRALTVREASAFVPRQSNGVSDRGSTTRGVGENGRLLPHSPLTGRLLWVGNLSFATRPSMLRNMAAAAANLPPRSVWCSLSRDKLGRSMGWATLRFDDADIASAAKTCISGMCIDDRTLQVEWNANTRPELPVISSDGGSEDSHAGHPVVESSPKNTALSMGLTSTVVEVVGTTSLPGDREVRIAMERERVAEFHAKYMPKARTAYKASLANKGLLSPASRAALLGAGHRAIQEVSWGTKAEARWELLAAPREARRSKERRSQRMRARSRRLQVSRAAASGRCVFVASLPFDALPRQLHTGIRKALAAAGIDERVAPHVFCNTDRSGRPLGTARVAVRTRADTERVVSALNGTLVRGRRVVARLDRHSTG